MFVRADSRVSARLSASAAVLVVFAARMHSRSTDSMDAWSLAFRCADMVVRVLCLVVPVCVIWFGRSLVYV